VTTVEAPSSAPTGRATWHRRTGRLPLAYLCALVAVAFAHPVLPQWRWLAIHLLLLGAVTNAILVWSAHFTSAVLRLASRRAGEVTRLVVLNAGVLAVLCGGSADLPWVGVGGAAAVFVALAGHLHWLLQRLRIALPARFRITVHYYVAATLALLTGIPVGAFMLVVDDDLRPRLVLFHAHVNLLGWVTLTVLGTLLTLWPTILRTRVADGAVTAARAALPATFTGLLLLAVGVLVWWPVLAVVGIAGVGLGALISFRPAWVAARAKQPGSFASWSFAAWSIAAGAGWLLAALGVDAVAIASAHSPDEAAGRFGIVAVPLLVGFTAQTLLGALGYLLPMALGGGPTRVRQGAATLDRWWPQRVAMGNAALMAFLLPVPSFVKIATSMLVLAALVQFLVPAVRLIVTRRELTGPAVAPPVSVPPEPHPAPTRPGGGVAVGLALVLLAVLIGVAAQRATDPTAGAASADVPATGHTTTVTVSAQGMRFHPDHITVPAGDRLVIELSNRDNRRHDLVLANGARTAPIGPHGTAHLDAGVIGATVAGWCSLPGHRQAGMTLTITVERIASGASADHAHGATFSPGPAMRIDPMADPGPGFTARDATAPPAPTDRLHRVELRVQETRREVAPGVHQLLWTFNGTAPGPVLRGRVGDTFEVTLVNDGTVDHGIDFHAGALAPDQPMRPIDPGQRLTFRFTATKAGIWMYHCSTMPMLMHVGNGMYGAVIIDPPDLPTVDREYVLVQSEFYLGPEGQPGDLAKMQAERPDAVAFNGHASQYLHRPLSAAAGDRVRFWVLDAGPSRTTAFHVVGAQFDTVYREGRWLLRPDDPGGAQVLDLAPATGGFVETVFDEPGHYPFLSHVMVDAERGARGVIKVR